MKITSIYGTQNSTGSPYGAFLRCCEYLHSIGRLSDKELSEAAINLLSSRRYVPYVSRYSNRISFVIPDKFESVVMDIGRYIFISDNFKSGPVIVAELL
jgi:hypothetical protein